MSLKNCAVQLVSILFLVGCGGSGDSSNNPPAANGNPNAVAWERVPSRFNPEIKSSSLDITGAQKIKMDLFGFADDVRVIYSPRQAANTATLNIYTVFADFATWGGLVASRQGSDFSIQNDGQYECEIAVENGVITSLKGGCYVRVELILSANAEVEVYNVGELVSPRFVPVDNATFIKSVRDAMSDDERNKAIDDYLGSYNRRRPSLAAGELGQVIHEFSFDEGKFATLTRLQMYVYDRGNLESMIEDEFSPFQQNDARRIVGLPPRD